MRVSADTGCRNSQCTYATFKEAADGSYTVQLLKQKLLVRSCPPPPSQPSTTGHSSDRAPSAHPVLTAPHSRRRSPANAFTELRLSAGSH